MKKILSIALCIVMVLSLSVTTYAVGPCEICGTGEASWTGMDVESNVYDNICDDCHNKYCEECECLVLEGQSHKAGCSTLTPSYSTEVSYTATQQEAYTVSVPASLAPGASGNVTVEGAWPDNKKVKVSADENVVLTNSILSSDKKTLAITFAGIKKKGDNEKAIIASDAGCTVPVSVAAISDALFGTWEGTFNYEVSIEDISTIAMLSVPPEKLPVGAVDGKNATLDGSKKATFMSEAPLSEFEEVQIDAETVDSSNYDVTDGYTLVTIHKDFLFSLGNGEHTITIVSKSVEATCEFETQIEPGLYDGEGTLLCPWAEVGLDVETDYQAYGNDMLDSTIEKTYPATKCVVLPEGITRIGNYVFWYCTGLTSVTIPRSVTSIGKGAFQSCHKLTSVTIPDVVEIGDSAFAYCEGLTSIEIPNSVTSIGYGAFDSCSGLTSVTIPNGITSISSHAFTSCRGLTSVTIPNSVTSIGSDAFWGCMNLTSIDIPSNVKSIGSSAFEGCSSLTSVTLPSGIYTIESRLFKNCGCLTSVTIPSVVTRIYYEAFANCYSLTSITIPSKVTMIESDLFSGCTGLASIVVSDGNKNFDSRDNCNAIIKTKTNTLIYGCKNTVIPSSVESIGEDAFNDCYGLTSITIPEGVTSISYYAFSGCTGLTSIVVSEGNTVYDSRDNCNAIIETATNTLIAGCKNTVIPSSVTSIGKGAFCDCNSLTSVTIPSSVKSIGNSAFYDCDGLTSVVIPNGVTSIDNSAFRESSGLISVTLPDSLESIGDYAFGFCENLTSVIYKGTTYTSVSALESALTNNSVSLGNNALYRLGLSS